jgi:hypothetical protein
MAGTSNFQQFNPSQNNQLTDADYALSTYRLNGATAGVAPSIDHNKLYYQLSTFVAAMAQAFADHGYTVSDASLSTLTSVLDNIVLGLNPNISSICLGSQIYLSIVGTDLWITGNAYYDGSNWQRVDTALASFLGRLHRLKEWLSGVPSQVVTQLVQHIILPEDGNLSTY